MSSAMRSTPSFFSPHLASKLKEFWRIVGAVLLQDMRTRFGASYFGYLIAIAWPLAHMVLIIVAYYIRTRLAPVGDSPTMFISTGVIPYILCLYPARLMAMAIVQNRSLLNLPVVYPIHLIVSRCILEMLNAMVVLSIFLFVLYLLDFDVMPTDLSEAMRAVGAAIFLGFGLGFMNISLCLLMGGFFMLFFLLAMAGLYIFSGVYIPTSVMPETVREYIVYNPIFNIVEWMRSAYYTSYDGQAINRTLVVGVGAAGLTIGLAGERFLRGAFLR